MQFVSRRSVTTHILVKGTEQTKVQVSNAPAKVRVVQSASPLPVVGGGYDQSSPTDGIRIVGDTLRVDIDSLPNAD